MEKGVVQLLESISISNTATAEEMKEIVRPIVDKVCDVTGLVVTRVEEHERGAFFVLGEEENGHEVIAIGNINQSGSYYTTLLISRIGVNGALLNTTTSQTNLNSLMFYISRNPSSMRWVKYSDGIALSFANQAPESFAANPNLVMSKVVGEDGNSSESTALFFSGSQVYASFSSLLDNVNSNDVVLDLSYFKGQTVPKNKEALSDIYPKSGATFPGLLFFTNAIGINPWGTIMVDGKRYMVCTKNYCSLLVRE